MESLKCACVCNIHNGPLVVHQFVTAPPALVRLVLYYLPNVLQPLLYTVALLVAVCPQDQVTSHSREIVEVKLFEADLHNNVKYHYITKPSNPTQTHGQCNSTLQYHCTLQLVQLPEAHSPSPILHVCPVMHVAAGVKMFIILQMQLKCSVANVFRYATTLFTLFIILFITTQQVQYSLCLIYSYLPDIT